MNFHPWGVGVIIFNFLAKKNGHATCEEQVIVESVKLAFKRVKQELDEQLSCINENSQDVSELNELVLHLDRKIDKLTERLDNLDIVLNPKFQVGSVQLTKREQEVFLALSSSSGLTAVQVAKVLGFTPDMVNLYIINMIGKGVPIRKELAGDLLVFSIESDFKDIQLRRNILNIDSRLSRQAVERQ
jgi:DNA-binding CsgD family transcriptional regulator